MIFTAFESWAAFVVLDHSNSKQKARKYKQKTSPQSYKTQIKILPFSGLA